MSGNAQWVEEGPREAFRAVASAVEGGEGLLRLAWELAGIPRDAPPAGRVALAALAWAALAAEQAGSTRTPIDADARRTLAESLGLRADAAKELERLVEPTRPPAGHWSAGLIGPPGSPMAPLVVQGGHLQLGRLASAEAALAAVLGPRLALAPRPRKPGRPARGAPGRDEEAVARAVKAVLAAPARSPSGVPVVLSHDQSAALGAVVGRPFGVVTGGPGTGKTSLAVALLRVALRLGLAPEGVALAAPTGKAAHRLGESIRAALTSLPSPTAAEQALRDGLAEPRTLHRLLGWNPGAGRFFHHAGNPLAARLVLVDESSMVDLSLMARLVASLAPEAQLLLLGDADQLPSVDAGTVFRDLVSWGHARKAPFVGLLTHSHRMDATDPSGSQVLAAAQAIQGSAIPDEPALEPDDEPSAQSSGPVAACFQPLASPSLPTAGGAHWFDASGPGALERALPALLDGWFKRFLASDVRPEAFEPVEVDEAGRVVDAASHKRLGITLDRLESQRLLVLLRSDTDPAGAGRINQLLHDRLAAEPGMPAHAPWLPGEPVLVTFNDPVRQLFNGDPGMVVRLTRRTASGAEGPLQLGAAFRSGEGFVVFSLESLRGGLERAFALTVHKAQGSEYATVGLVLPAHDSPLLTRELLYTAVTRAKRQVVGLGPLNLLERGARRLLSRDSGLVELLEAEG